MHWISCRLLSMELTLILAKSIFTTEHWAVIQHTPTPFNFNYAKPKIIRFWSEILITVFLGSAFALSRALLTLSSWCNRCCSTFSSLIFSRLSFSLAWNANELSLQHISILNTHTVKVFHNINIRSQRFKLYIMCSFVHLLSCIIFHTLGPCSQLCKYTLFTT